MYPRTNYEMTEADLDALLKACDPVPYMIVGGMEPSSPQENANRAWAALGAKMGFDSMSVEPISGKGMRFFTAVPTENEAQKVARLANEAAAKRAQDILDLEHQQSVIADRLKELRSA